jgi:hypothetical protein
VAAEAESVAATSADAGSRVANPLPPAPALSPPREAVPRLLTLPAFALLLLLPLLLLAVLVLVLLVRILILVLMLLLLGEALLLLLLPAPRCLPESAKAAASDDGGASCLTISAAARLIGGGGGGGAAAFCDGCKSSQGDRFGLSCRTVARAGAAVLAVAAASCDSARNTESVPPRWGPSFLSPLPPPSSSSSWRPSSSSSSSCDIARPWQSKAAFKQTSTSPHAVERNSRPVWQARSSRRSFAARAVLPRVRGTPTATPQQQPQQQQQQQQHQQQQ